MTIKKYEAGDGPFRIVVMHNEEFHPMVGWVPCIAVSIHNDDSKKGMAFTFDGPGFERFADAVASFAADGPMGVPDEEFHPNWAEALSKERGPDYKRRALAASASEAEVKPEWTDSYWVCPKCGLPAVVEKDGSLACPNMDYQTCPVLTFLPYQAGFRFGKPPTIEACSKQKPCAEYAKGLCLHSWGPSHNQAKVDE